MGLVMGVYLLKVVRKVVRKGFAKKLCSFPEIDKIFHSTSALLACSLCAACRQLLPARRPLSVAHETDAHCSARDASYSCRTLGALIPHFFLLIGSYGFFRWRTSLVSDSVVPILVQFSVLSTPRTKICDIRACSPEVVNYHSPRHCPPGPGLAAASFSSAFHPK